MAESDSDASSSSYDLGQLSDASGSSYGLSQLLGSAGRDFLVNSKGEQVNIAKHFQGKTVGIYFSAHWCGPCRSFTPSLAEVYREINAAEVDQPFEVVFVSSDNDEESFKEYLAEMPWLAVPFSDSETRDRLDGEFEVAGIPRLVLLKAEPGSTTVEVINDDVDVNVVQEHGAEAFPFSEERLEELEAAEEAAKKNQTVASVLGSKTRDYLLNKNGDKVLLSELEEKVVGILFYSNDDEDCEEFVPVLVNAYQELKRRGEPFEIVLVSLATDKDSYDEAIAAAPWPLAVPFTDKAVKRLVQYFELEELPTLVILGRDGKTVHSNAKSLVEGLGARAFPFTPEKEEELKQAEQKKRDNQTLESILVQGDLDFVVGKDGARVPVRDLIGKTVLIYFSAHWCPPCRGFTPRLVEVYNELKSQGKAIEVVFASRDEDEESFNDYFGSMPWLALPLNDPRKKTLNKQFDVEGIPTLVALEPSGKTATLDARDLVEEHGAAAFPFTEARVRELEGAEVKGWPDRIEFEGHEHELDLTRRPLFVCDMCKEDGQGWSFCCEECDFDAHPKCAMETTAAEEVPVDGIEGGEVAAGEEALIDGEGGEVATAESEKPNGYFCEGDVCRRV